MDDADHKCLFVMKGEARFFFDPQAKVWHGRSAIDELSTASIAPNANGEGFSEQALISVLGQLRGRRKTDHELITQLCTNTLDTLVSNNGDIKLWCYVEDSPQERVYELTLELAHQGTRPQVKTRLIDVTGFDRDERTGLRRIANLEDELAAWLEMRPGKVKALLIIDIDRFKSEINDQLGHPAGNQVLARDGKILNDYTTREVRPGRIGGDEFAVMVDAGTQAEFYELAEKITAALQFTMMVGGCKIHVTHSVGAVVAVPGESAKDLFQRADAAMYKVKQAKRAGRETRLAWQSYFSFRHWLRRST